MHPLLVQLTLPAWPIPLAGALGVAAALALAFTLWARRRGARDLALVGAVLALVAAAGAVALYGSAYVPQAIRITTYGAALCVALALGWGIVSGLGRNDGLPAAQLEGASIAAVAGGLIGARLEYLTHATGAGPAWVTALDVSGGGLALQGALLLGALAAFAERTRRRADFLSYADVATPAVAFGLGLGRLGSYGMGSGFGRPLGTLQLPGLASLGTFPRWDLALLEGRGAPAWVEHARRGWIPATSAASLPVHPTQLYLAAAAAALLVIVTVVRHRRRFTGQVFLVGAFVEAALRYPIEVLRDDPERWLVGPRLTADHAVGAGLLVVAAAFVVGPARSLRGARTRRAMQVGALLGAATGWWLLRWSELGRFEVSLSAAQWTALATVVGAAAAWEPLARRASGA